MPAGNKERLLECLAYRRVFEDGASLYRQRGYRKRRMRVTSTCHLIPNSEAGSPFKMTVAGPFSYVFFLSKQVSSRLPCKKPIPVSLVSVSQSSVQQKSCTPLLCMCVCVCARVCGCILVLAKASAARRVPAAHTIPNKFRKRGGVQKLRSGHKVP